jgi:hypothetical protein
MTLVEMLLQEKGHRPRRGKAHFLAHLAEIEQAIAAGFPKKDVWEALRNQGKIPISYNQFLIYTQRIIEQKNAPKALRRLEVVAETPPSEPVKIKIGETSTAEIQARYVQASKKKPTEW